MLRREAPGPKRKTPTVLPTVGVNVAGLGWRGSSVSEAYPSERRRPWISLTGDNYMVAQTAKLRYCRFSSICVGKI